MWNFFKSTDRSNTRLVFESQDAYVRNLVEKSRIDSKENDSDDSESDSDEHQPMALRSVGPKFRMADETSKPSEIEDFTCYDFPFENLVLQGGGAKGIAYIGAVQVLEKTGIMKNIHRFGGASAGAIVASLLAVGFTSDELKDALSRDLSELIYDHRPWIIEKLSYLIDLRWRNGIFSGNRAYDWFGELLKKKTGNSDITFKEVYQSYKRELCIVAANLNMMTLEHFHVKTTPDVPVREAIFLSMSIPGIFRPRSCKINGVENVYVDGGVLCNYPIHCFDGWWLSMNPDDSFLKKLQPLQKVSELYDKRFEHKNSKTVGMVVFDEDQSIINREDLEERDGKSDQKYPNTELRRAKAKVTALDRSLVDHHGNILKAVDAFKAVLDDLINRHPDGVSVEELRNALTDTFPTEHATRLFGTKVTLDDVLADLKKDGSGEVDIDQLLRVIERTGVSLLRCRVGFRRKELGDFPDFYVKLIDTVMNNSERTSVGSQDVERTVAINTGYVGTLDFKLEDADKEYAIEQGRRSTLKYLRYYVDNNQPPKKH